MAVRVLTRCHCAACVLGVVTAALVGLESHVSDLPGHQLEWALIPPVQQPDHHEETPGGGPARTLLVNVASASATDVVGSIKSTLPGLRVRFDGIVG